MNTKKFFVKLCMRAKPTLQIFANVIKKYINFSNQKVFFVLYSSSLKVGETLWDRKEKIKNAARKLKNFCCVP